MPIVSGYLIFVLSRWRCSLCTEIVCNSGFIPSDWIDLVTNHNGRKTEFFLYLMIKLPVSSARSYYWLFGSFGVISAICVTIDDRSGAKSTDLESVRFICSSCCHNCRLIFFIKLTIYDVKCVDWFVLHLHFLNLARRSRNAHNFFILAARLPQAQIVGTFSISLIAVRHKLLLQNFPPERAHFFQWLYTFFAFLVNLWKYKNLHTSVKNLMHGWLKQNLLVLLMHGDVFYSP